MNNLSRPNKNAIVLGASMAGLLTARVLSEHFDHVTLLERDAVSSRPEARKGQPQTRHLHGLLASGLEIMTGYYPDLIQALADEGAMLNDFGASMNWYTYGGFRQRFTLGTRTAIMSRPLLEFLVRERTLARDNVTLLDECAVRGLHTNQDRTQVVGVEIDRRGEGVSETLAAALVVDCTGRGSRTPQWLAELGYPEPTVSEVKVNVGYATQLFKRDPADPLGQEWTLVTPEAPRETRFGGMFPLEGDRWIVSMGGWAGDHAPTDAAGFLEYARSLPSPDIYNTMVASEPLSDVYPYKFTSSLRRHYEKLDRFPTGYLVLGDAICSFNPTYGQGMSSAAMQVAALDKLLSEQKDEHGQLASTFFKRAAKIIDIPWQLAVGEDFRFPETSGPKPAGTDLLNRYVAMVHRATLVDPVVCQAFAKVMNLMAPPPSLMAPGIMIRVIRANRKLKRERQTTQSTLVPATA